MNPEEIYTDHCYLERNLWTKLFPYAKIVLDLFHAAHTVVREANK